MEEGPFDPRQRLIGAVILVVLAVVILPILLKRPPSRQTGQDVLTIRRSGHGLTTDWSKATQAATAPTQEAAAPPTIMTSAVVPEKALPIGAAGSPTRARTPVVRAASAKPQVLPAQPTSMAAAHPLNEWYVQVGAYVNAGDAIAFGRRLRAQGFLVRTRLTRLPSGRGIVVVLGPYSRAQAQRARASVSRRDKVQGFLIHAIARAR